MFSQNYMHAPNYMVSKKEDFEVINGRTIDTGGSRYMFGIDCFRLEGYLACLEEDPLNYEPYGNTKYMTIEW